MKQTANTPPATTPSVVPVTEALPDALFGAKEALLDDDETSDWLGDRLMPQDVSFAEMALLDRLRRRPYHTVQLSGPIDGLRLARAYADKLYRTESFRAASGKTSISSLLLCLGEGVFAFFVGGSLKIYAPTPQAAHSAAKDFLRFAKPRRTSKKAGFH